MTAALVAGIVAGYAIAIPVGAVGAYLVTLTARTSLRVGAAAALGVAAVDGLYALIAVVGGSAIAGAIGTVQRPLQWVSAVVLVVVAAAMVAPALRRSSSPTTVPTDSVDPGPGPGRAFVTLFGLTVVNPATVVYFAALVVGGTVTVTGSAAKAVFVAAAFLASASWQLVLAIGGSGLGRIVAGERGRRVTSLVGALVVVALAVRLVVSPG